MDTVHNCASTGFFTFNDNHKTMDLSCVIASICFFVSNILRAVVFVRVRNRDTRNENFEDWLNLEPKVLAEEWDNRRDDRLLETFSGCVNALAWLVFAIPMIHVSMVLLSKPTTRSTRKSVHVAIGFLAVAGAISEILSRLMVIGSVNAMRWLAFSFNVEQWITQGEDDNIGLKALELVHVAIEGTMTWVDAAEWIFLAFMLLMLFISVAIDRESPFSLAWASFGLVVAGMCLLDFAADILRFQAWGAFSFIALVISTVNRLTLFPVWLLWLGRQLSRVASASVKTDSSNGNGDTDAGVI